MEMKGKKLKSKIYKGILLNNLERRVFCFKVFERKAKHKIAQCEKDVLLLGPQIRMKLREL
jgi:cellobiose-specific phosphotransferase system component IIB